MVARKLSGRAWVFGDALDVDWEICSFEVVREEQGRGTPMTDEEFGRYCMVNVDPDFPKKVRKGDFIVAGENVGYGHDHDHACRSIKGAGVSAVICESTNTNFQRNAIHHGLPVVDVRGVKGIVNQGDELELDMERGVVKNRTTGAELRFAPYPSFILEMLDAGGLYPFTIKQIQEGKVK
ncbi:MAG: 3-isopropylmalate dehydratase [Chloroflexi bacterium]|nr:3-isopropylmalate dehydratase [Chloroflexota bacterium]